MTPEEELLEAIRRGSQQMAIMPPDHLQQVLRKLERIGRTVDDLVRGHNGLVRLIQHQGADMSAVSDAILAEDTQAVALIEAVKVLVNKLTNGKNTLDADTKAALDQLTGHLNTVTQEVADATPADTTPTGGGDTQPPADGSTPADGTSQPFSSGPDAGTVGV